SANCAANRTARSLNSALVSVRSPQVSAGLAGSSTARRSSCSPNDVSFTAPIPARPGTTAVHVRDKWDVTPTAWTLGPAPRGRRLAAQLPVSPNRRYGAGSPASRSIPLGVCWQCAPGGRERHRAVGEMSTGHDFDASSTSSSSNCPNVSCIASAAPPPSASSASLEGKSSLTTSNVLPSASVRVTVVTEPFSPPSSFVQTMRDGGVTSRYLPKKSMPSPNPRRYL